MSNPDAPPLTEAEMARMIAAGVLALEAEEQAENRKHYQGLKNRSAGGVD